MEVRPGYKQTEVGVIPEDWDVKPLGELSTSNGVGRTSMANPEYSRAAVSHSSSITNIESRHDST